MRGDEVASSIEAHVREAIERMVSEINSSIDDVRSAVDSQLKAASQSVQADVNSISFLPHIKKVIAELEEGMTPAAPMGGGGGGDASKLKACIQTIERGKSQVDVLNALLEQCLQFGSRATLLILRGDTFSGWKGVGFSAHGGNDESVKRFNAAPGVVSQLDTVLRDEHVVEWDGANLATRFGASAPARAVVIPMVIKDKVSAAVYVDALPQDVTNFDRPSIEMLVFITGLLVDTLAIRKKIPSPTLSDGAMQPVFAEPAPAPAPPPRATPRPATPTISAPRPIPTPTPAPAPTHAPAFTPQVVRQAPVPAPRPADAAPMAAPAMAPALDERPSTQFVPPSGLQRGGPLGSGTEEGKKHDEARRFARLLVSEIKLYNEAKVEQGRRSRDLYERLKDDIDRSRQMYDERISEDVRRNSNYFYDELVRILADGNADALGL
ncbi:MAG TPA: hypothetical protein VLV78_04195 [Thermoanaerobaculia bacterium]|nr:hypothetical protein [Thermoanaerobaculia bacterium]